VRSFEPMAFLSGHKKIGGWTTCSQFYSKGFKLQKSMAVLEVEEFIPNYTRGSGQSFHVCVECH